MIQWGKALVLLLTLAMSVVDVMRKRRDLADAEALILSKQLQKVLSDVKTAQAERDRVRTELADHPERVHDDDGFKRRK